MAQQGIKLDQETFSCSICLDLLKDPVSLSCGHNYCMDCIKDHWDREDRKQLYSCPQCRQSFSQRPVLMKNTMLAELVEELQKNELKLVSVLPAKRCYAGPEDVACDFCTGRKLKALRSCLFCLASYCETHLQPHYKSPTFAKHKLVKPSKKLQENLCSRHNEVMKIFCRADRQLICHLCLMDEHKGHDTVSAEAERVERQKELVASRQSIQCTIQDREEDLKVLRKQVEAINGSAEKVAEESEKTFADLICLIQKRSFDVKKQIKFNRETEVSLVEKLQEELEEEINELKRRDAELKQLSHTEDHTQFIHSCPSLSQFNGPTASARIDPRPRGYFEDVTAAVSEARDKLQDFLKDIWTSISPTETTVDVFQPQSEPRTRDDFLRYSRDLTLDPNSSNRDLLLSDENRKATFMCQKQSYSRHRDRFTTYFQVLSAESLTGCCYWEVERKSGGGIVAVAVAYKNICRAGHESAFGFNDRSWTLLCYKKSYNFEHNKVRTPVSGPKSSRIGVYLDHGGGVLSFYSVSETMTLLHRVQTTFTRPLYAGLCFFCDPGNTAEFSKLR